MVSSVQNYSAITSTRGFGRDHFTTPTRITSFFSSKARLCFQLSIFIFLKVSANSFLYLKQLPPYAFHLSPFRKCHIQVFKTPSFAIAAVSNSVENFNKNIGYHENLNEDWKTKREQTVWILDKGPNHAVVYKPPSVICHHSEWSGSGKKNSKKEMQEPTPMLQRVRDALNVQSIDYDSEDGVTIINQTSFRRVNLVHRLDRGASGCLLFAFADNDIVKNNQSNYTINDEEYSPTASLQQAMESKNMTITNTAMNISSNFNTTHGACKTYVALVRGSGILKERDLKTEGWFPVHRAIKDESGQLRNATTYFNFIAGTDGLNETNTALSSHDNVDTPPPRASLVLARPITGRWHQVRKHLNGLSHPILGDTSHGSSKTNKEWRKYRNMPYQRTFLHLARLQLPQTPYTPPLDVSCPLPPDFMELLQHHLPSVLENAKPKLEMEGIDVPSIEMLTSAAYFGGTSASDSQYSELPPLQKRYEEKLQLRKDRLLDDENSDAYVKILHQGSNYAVAYKPPGIVCHHSSWTERGNNLDDEKNTNQYQTNKHNEPIPMLQRVRDAIAMRYSSTNSSQTFQHTNDRGKNSIKHHVRVNLIHRLDRSASGCLLFSIPPKSHFDPNALNDIKTMKEVEKETTKSLMTALQSPNSTKTYIALVHGNGTHNGEDLTKKGWFTVSTPLKDENGKYGAGKNAITHFRFISTSYASFIESNQKEKIVDFDNNETNVDRNREATLVLARPQTGKYHQIRLHLSQQLHHPIIGDSSHGNTVTNRIWKKYFGLLPQRSCLHLARIQVPLPSSSTPLSHSQNKNIDVQCPLSMAGDMMKILEKTLPNLLLTSKGILEKEGVIL